MRLTCLWNVILCVWWLSGLWNEWRAEDGCDLLAGRGVERPRPSSPGEESHSKHTKAGYISTTSHTLKLRHFLKLTPNGSVFEYKCRSFSRFCFQGILIRGSWLFLHSALSQDDQDDAQLKIEDILQMVRICYSLFYMFIDPMKLLEKCSFLSSRWPLS